MYSYDGEMLFVAEIVSQFEEEDEDDSSSGTQALKDAIVGEMRDKVLNELSKRLVHRFTLNKLEKGYLMATDGKIYKNTGQMVELEYHTIDSADDGFGKVKTKQGHNFGFKTKNGIVTTKGLNQYGAFSHHGVNVKVMGALRHAGPAADVFNLVKLGMSDDKMSQPLPAAVFHPAIAPIAIVGELIVGDMMDDLNEAVDGAMLSTLKRVKMEGVERVEMFLKTPGMQDMGYEIEEVSAETAFKLLQGEFNSISEALRHDFENDINGIEHEKNIHVLYRTITHPVSRDNIEIVETFFIK